MDKARTEGLQPEAIDHALVQRYRLRVLAGLDAGTSFASNGPRLTIGTHPSTDFTLTDPTLSRFHCEITLQEGVPIVRDLGSLNGTAIDGIRITEAPLRADAVLWLGRTRVRFDLGKKHVKIPLSTEMRFGRMVGQSRVMRAAFAVLQRAAQSDMTVLLQGETGTGKDIAAESLHRSSTRANGPFIVVDCGAIPSNLIENELFGHEKGAFTGAEQTRPGAFEEARGGTLFLDEIGELRLDLQPALLRVLESREVQRVGSSKRAPIDVRIVAATNRNLRMEVNQGRFRSDLYYRLAVLEVTLPPLRECPGDLPLLVEQLLCDMNAQDRPAATSLRDPAFLSELALHPWPGNVRELRNYLERCLVMHEPVPLSVSDQAGAIPMIDSSQPLRAAREQWLLHFERGYLSEVLRKNNHNVSAAARAAGIDRIHFYRLMARCGLR